MFTAVLNNSLVCVMQQQQVVVKICFAIFFQPAAWSQSYVTGKAWWSCPCPRPRSTSTADSRQQ